LASIFFIRKETKALKEKKEDLALNLIKQDIEAMRKRFEDSYSQMAIQLGRVQEIGHALRALIAEITSSRSATAPIRGMGTKTHMALWLSPLPLLIQELSTLVSTSVCTLARLLAYHRRAMAYISPLMRRDMAAQE